MKWKRKTPHKKQIPMPRIHPDQHHIHTKYSADDRYLQNSIQ